MNRCLRTSPSTSPASSARPATASSRRWSRVNDGFSVRAASCSYSSIVIGSADPANGSTSLIGYPGIGLRVREVREEIDGDEHHAEEQHRALDRGKVATRDGIHDIASQARPAEDRFREN